MRVAVAGGSLAGLFIACLLRKAGHDAHVYERSSTGLAGRGAGLVPQEDVFVALRRLGLFELATVGVVARERIFLDRAGDIIARYATPQMHVSWDQLYGGLRDLLGPEAYHVGHSAVEAGQDRDMAWLEFAAHPRVEADLVIGADGIGSHVRAAVVGTAQRAHYTGYVAWRGLVPEEALTGPAAETLLDRFAFYTARASQALGYVVPGPAGETIPGARRYNWVWYRRANLSETLTGRDGVVHPFSLGRGQMGETARDALRAAGQKLLPPQFRDALLAEPDPFVQAIFDYETPRMVDGRLALIGDSAFVARPHTAMGVGKAAAEALALADALASQPVEAALRAYERLRLPQGRAIVQYGRRLGEFME